MSDGSDQIASVVAADAVHTEAAAVSGSIASGAGFEAGLAAFSFTTFGVGLLAAGALYGINQLLKKKPKDAVQKKDLSENRSDPVSALPVIYGTTQVGVNKIAISTDGAYAADTQTNGAVGQYLWLACAVSQGPVSSFNQILLDGNPAVDQWGRAIGQHNSSNLPLARSYEQNVAAWFAYGTDGQMTVVPKNRGAITVTNLTTAGKWAVIVTTATTHPFFIGDCVSFTGSGGTGFFDSPEGYVVQAVNSSTQFVLYNPLGVSGVAPSPLGTIDYYTPDLVNEQRIPGWTSSFNGKGVAWVLLRLTWSTLGIWSTANGVPKVTVNVTGGAPYDPRLAAGVAAPQTILDAADGGALGPYVHTTSLHVASHGCVEGDLIQVTGTNTTLDGLQRVDRVPDANHVLLCVTPYLPAVSGGTIARLVRVNPTPTTPTTTAATALTAGHEYEILTMGTTTEANWASAGAPSTNGIGTVFTATGVTIGTGTALDLTSSTPYLADNGNPALAVRDYLTHPVHGLGASPSDIDDTLVAAAANQCDTLVNAPVQNTSVVGGAELLNQTLPSTGGTSPAKISLGSNVQSSAKTLLYQVGQKIMIVDSTNVDLDGFIHTITEVVDAFNFIVNTPTSHTTGRSGTVAAVAWTNSQQLSSTTVSGASTTVVTRGSLATASAPTLSITSITPDIDGSAKVTTTTPNAYVAGQTVHIVGSGNGGVPDGYYVVAKAIYPNAFDLSAHTIFSTGAAGTVQAAQPNGYQVGSNVLIQGTSTAMDGGYFPITSITDQVTFVITTGALGATTVNVGTVQEQVLQPQFAFGGTLEGSESLKTNLESILACQRAQLVFQGGVYAPTIRAPGVSQLSLNESNILGDWHFVVPGQEMVNVVRGTFVNPLNSWQKDQVLWPNELTPNVFLADDQNQLNQADIDLPLVNNSGRAQQICMVRRSESRVAIQVGVTVTESALVLAVDDLVDITHATPGWVAQKFWVTMIEPLPNATVRLTLEGYAENAYNLEIQNDLAIIGPQTTLVNPALQQPTVTYQVLAPSSLVYTGVAMEFTVTGADVDGTTPTVTLFGITANCSIASGTAFVSAGSFSAGTIYTIVSVGTTDFTAIGARANTVGLSFTATGVGSGSGTAAPQSANGSTWRIIQPSVNSGTAATGSVLVKATSPDNVDSAWLTIPIPTGNLLTGQQGTGTVNANGVVSFNVDAPAIYQSFKWLTSGTGYTYLNFPADGLTASTGTLVNAPGPFPLSNVDTIAFGDIDSLTVVPFTGPSATGVQGPSIHLIAAFQSYSGSLSATYSAGGASVDSNGTSGTGYTANSLTLGPFAASPNTGGWGATYTDPALSGTSGADAYFAFPQAPGCTLTTVAVDYYSDGTAGVAHALSLYYIDSSGVQHLLARTLISPSVGWTLQSVGVFDSTTGRAYLAVVVLADVIPSTPPVSPGNSRIANLYVTWIRPNPSAAL